MLQLIHNNENSPFCLQRKGGLLEDPRWAVNEIWRTLTDLAPFILTLVRQTNALILQITYLWYLF